MLASFRCACETELAAGTMLQEPDCWWDSLGGHPQLAGWDLMEEELRAWSDGMVFENSQRVK